MTKTLIARLREPQSKHPAVQQLLQQEMPVPQATARHRNLFEAALQQQAQQMLTSQPAAERPRNLFEAAFQQQAQALNQQPDSIPAMMKPGEYVLPPDTVAAMGGPGALDAAVAQTHVSGNQQAAVPPGFEPKHFFANGGLVAPDDEQRKPGDFGTPATTPAPSPATALAAAPGGQPAAPATSAQTPRAQFVADQNAKLAAANTGLAERTQQMNERYRPAPNSPSSTFPGNRMPGAESTAPNVGQPVGQQQKQGLWQIAQQQAQPSAQNMQAANVGAGLANTASRGMAAMAGIPTPTSQPLGVPGTTPGGSAVGQKAVGPSPNLFEAAKAQEAQQVGSAPGVYKHGEGQYSDNAQGMGFAPGFTGQPSAQNTQAANALAGQQQAQSLGRVAAQQQAQQQEAVQQPRGFAAPQISHSGNDFTARQNLRGLKMDAEWAMQRAKRKKYAMQDPAVMAYQAALQGDMAARYGGQAALEAKTNDTNAGLQREQMQQDGATQREVGQSAIARDRLANDQRQQAITNDLAERRFALDDRKAGTANMPSGYRASADGRGLEAIPGGPADPRQQNKPLNETQSKSLAFGARMQQSAGQLDDLARQGVDQPGYIKRAADAVGAGVLANWTQSAGQQQVEQSQRDYVNAVLRRESGAAISNAEFDNARQQYFPQPWDSPQVIEQKRRNRLLSTQAMLAEVPNSAERVAHLEQMVGGGLAQQHQQAQGGQGGKQGGRSGQGVQGEQPPQFRVMRTGVYNGRRVVQYEDGSLSYAD